MTVQEAWGALLNTPVDHIFEAIGAFAVGLVIVFAVMLVIFMIVTAIDSD